MYTMDDNLKVLKLFYIPGSAGSHESLRPSYAGSRQIAPAGGPDRGWRSLFWVKGNFL